MCACVYVKLLRLFPTLYIEDKRKVTKLQWGGGGMDWKTGIDTYIHTIDFMYKIDN